MDSDLKSRLEPYSFALLQDGKHNSAILFDQTK
jgi:hypothetical protein